MNYDDPHEYPFDCEDCEGEGLVVGDCFEDTCCCADPASEHNLVQCPTCQGRGGFMERAD